MKIALVDYGVGNLRSVYKALSAVGGDVVLTSRPQDIQRADKVVLPGVGAFGDGMLGLQQRGLVEPIREAARRGVPLLGICLGMQLMLACGEETPTVAGLGLIDGNAPRFTDRSLKIPHTGWNQVEVTNPHPLLFGVPPGEYFYFNHSYFCQPTSPQDVLATCDYGLRFCAVQGRENLLGVQFHPEKSQAAGLNVLRNFVERC